VLTVDEDGPLLVFTAIGDGFLRGMVRRLVGTLRTVGNGQIRPEDVLDRPGPTAKARGLTLARVSYRDEPANREESSEIESKRRESGLSQPELPK
jgi:tRNA U38,U39,U40 pseudouridine synthase TruA